MSVWNRQSHPHLPGVPTVGTAGLVRRSEGEQHRMRTPRRSREKAARGGSSRRAGRSGTRKKRRSRSNAGKSRGSVSREDRRKDMQREAAGGRSRHSEYSGRTELAAREERVIR